MSVIGKPDNKGVRDVTLGGVNIGTVKEVAGEFQVKKQAFNQTHARLNLAIKALVANFRSQ